MAQKKCGVTLCPRLAQSNGFCFGHGYMRTDDKAQRNRELKKQKNKSMHLSAVLVPRSEMSINKLISILDDVFSEYIRRRIGDFAQCCTCNAIAGWKSLDAGHYIPRANMATRYNEKNVFPQCAVCNRLNDGFESRYRLFLVKKYGEEEVLELEALGRTVKTWSRSELLEMISFYRAEIKKL